MTLPKNYLTDRVEEFEKNVREVYEAAASTDDRSDIDCVISYATNFLTETITQSMEVGREMKKASRDITPPTSQVAQPERSLSEVEIEAQKILKELKVPNE